MKDVLVLKYNEADPDTTAMLGAKAYRCDMMLGDEVCYGPRGYALLVQLVYIELLKTPGRDVINNDGGGLLSLLGMSPLDDGLGTPSVYIERAVKAVEQQIMARQMGKGYPRNELLQSLTLSSSVYFDAHTGHWIVPVIIKSVAGDESLWQMPIGGVLA